MSETVIQMRSVLATFWRLVKRRPYLLVLPVAVAVWVADRERLNAWIDEAWRSGGEET